MLYTSLGEYYKVLNMFLDYKYSITDVENMIPFERELQIDIIMQNQREESVGRQVQTEAPID
jgi:hypothetical protein